MQSLLLEIPNVSHTIRVFLARKAMPHFFSTANPQCIFPESIRVLLTWPPTALAPADLIASATQTSLTGSAGHVV